MFDKDELLFRENLMTTLAAWSQPMLEDIKKRHPHRESSASPRHDREGWNDN